MKPTNKFWFIAAAALILAGLLLFASVMQSTHWDFAKLNTMTYDTKIHEIPDVFHTINLQTDTADITLLPAEDGQCRVVCYEGERMQHQVKVEDGTLTIRLTDTRTWRDHIGVFSVTPKITVYLPAEYCTALTLSGSTGDFLIQQLLFTSLDVSLSTGDIALEQITADTLSLSVSTGETKLQNVVCDSLFSTGDTGDLTLINVIAEERFSIQRSTGDVRFVNSDALDITVETSTGAVTGMLLTDKLFAAETSTGKIDIPSTTTGGKCEIRTSTGDIDIRISK